MGLRWAARFKYGMLFNWWSPGDSIYIHGVGNTTWLPAFGSSRTLFCFFGTGLACFGQQRGGRSRALERSFIPNTWTFGEDVVCACGDLGFEWSRFCNRQVYNIVFWGSDYSRPTLLAFHFQGICHDKWGVLDSIAGSLVEISDRCNIALSTRADTWKLDSSILRCIGDASPLDPTQWKELLSPAMDISCTHNLSAPREISATPPHPHDWQNPRAKLRSQPFFSSSEAVKRWWLRLTSWYSFGSRIWHSCESVLILRCMLRWIFFSFGVWYCGLSIWFSQVVLGLMLCCTLVR